MMCCYLNVRFQGQTVNIFRVLILSVTTNGFMGHLGEVKSRWPATSWVHYTTSCNTQCSAPEDGQNKCPKHVELTGIINKPLLLPSSWLSILFIFHFFFETC